MTTNATHRACRPAREFFVGRRPALRLRYAEFDRIFDPLALTPGLTHHQLDWLEKLRERFRWDAYCALAERLEDGTPSPASEVAEDRAARGLALLIEASQRTATKTRGPTERLREFA